MKRQKINQKIFFSKSLFDKSSSYTDDNVVFDNRTFCIKEFFTELTCQGIFQSFLAPVSFAITKANNDLKNVAWMYNWNVDKKY